MTKGKSYYRPSNGKTYEVTGTASRSGFGFNAGDLELSNYEGDYPMAWFWSPEALAAAVESGDMVEVA